MAWTVQELRKAFTIHPAAGQGQPISKQSSVMIIDDICEHVVWLTVSGNISKNQVA